MKVLVVVDMQNDFVNGALGTKEAEAIVPKVAKKIESFEGKIFYDTRAKFIERECAQKTDCFCSPAAFSKYLTIILQCGGYVSGRTVCWRNRSCGHQQRRKTLLHY